MKFRLVYLIVFIASLCAAQTIDSALTLSYKVNGFSFSYPKSWQVLNSNENSATVAPATAKRTTRSGRPWLSNGMYAGVRKTSFPNDPSQSAKSLFQALQKTNPGMVQLDSEAFHQDGHNAVVLGYTNTNPDAPEPESGTIAVYDLGQGQIAYLVLFCPSSQQSAWLPVFRRIIDGVSFNTTVQQGSDAASHVSVEPWQTLVRETTSVNAGKAMQYNFTLPAGAKLLAQFQVSGGLNDKIRVFLLNYANYQLYAAHQPFQYLPGMSGSVRGVASAQFKVPLDGVYYVVLDNGRAWLMPRNVTLHVDAVLPQSTQQSEQTRNALETQYSLLKKVFIFPDFRTFVKHCGVVNAFSNPDITICAELLEELQAQGMSSTVEFVYLHELGHTLMRQWQMPFYDNEDDADAFATAFLLMAKQQAIALQAAQWWASQSVTAKDAVAKVWMDDRHSLSPQRARNIIRWVNNRNEILPRWETTVFIPHMQTPILQGMLRDPAFTEKDAVRTELSHRGVPVQGL